MNDRSLTTFAVAKELSVVGKTVSNWIDRGYLKAYRTPGGHRRIWPKDLAEFKQKMFGERQSSQPGG